MFHYLGQLLEEHRSCSKSPLSVEISIPTNKTKVGKVFRTEIKSPNEMYEVHK